MTVVGQYRVQMRLSTAGPSSGTLREWALGTLDVLLEDERVVDADVAGTLATGEVEFDMQVHADTVPEAMQVASDALGDATRTGTRVPAVEHAEIDLVPVPA